MQKSQGTFSRVPRDIKDKMFKKTFNLFGQEFFKFLGIDEEILAIKNTEFVFFSKTFRLDLLVETKSGKLINIEFQSTKPTKEDFRRFYYYAHAASEEYGKIVETYIVLNDDVSDELFYEVNGIYYEFNKILLKHIDGDKFLEELEQKINNNDEITDLDFVHLALIGFTSTNLPIHKHIIHAINLINKINKIYNEEIYNIMYIIDELSHKWVEKKYLKEIKKVINMITSVFEDGFSEGYSEGRTDLIISMYNHNLPLEFIAKISGLSTGSIGEIIEIQKDNVDV